MDYEVNGGMIMKLNIALAVKTWQQMRSLVYMQN